MPKQLTTEQRIRAITLLEQGLNSREVAIRIGENIHHTIILQLKKKYEETENVENKPKSAVDVQKSLKVYDKIEVSQSTVRKEYFTYLGVGYLCKIDGGLDAELYQKILDEDFLNTLEYYDLDRKTIIF
ncbi:hypothetical protein GLOIN_2v1466586 [Rhizophagus clarus]|uniref:Uncharacterized protein n=1 Tax=Rhizophagus clarus TaxID=94130 RepID=A0A8H3L0D1_9GLOM|nr:hypothetical protein GLOIN_2v1466586 [Rhizophagus clarus]